MQLAAVRHALDGLDLFTFGLDREHQAGADQASVDGDAAGAAIARAAPFLAAGHVQVVAQHVEQSELRLAEKFRRHAVDGGGDVMLAHRRSPARSYAIVAVRRASTPATLMR